MLRDDYADGTEDGAEQTLDDARNLSGIGSSTLSVEFDANGSNNDNEEGSSTNDDDGGPNPYFLEPLQISTEDEDHEHHDEEEDDYMTHAPPRQSHWLVTFLLTVCSSLGSGVLAYSEIFTSLGWLNAILLAIAAPLINTAAGILLYKVAILEPRAIGPVQMVRAVSGGNWRGLTTFTSFALNLFFLFSVAIQLLTLQLCLRILFLDVLNYCTPIFGALAALIILPFLQVRTFHDLRWVALVNLVLFTIGWAIVIFLLLNDIFNEGLAETHLVEDDLSWVSFNMALSTAMSAAVGTDLYLQIMAETRHPGAMKSVIYSGNATLFVYYAMIGIVSYLHGNEPHVFLLDSLPRNALSLTATFCIASHVLIAYVIYAHPLHVWIQVRYFPSITRDYSCRSRIIWLAITVVVLVASYVLANSVPNFSQMIAVFGALVTPHILCFVPAFGLLYAKGGRHLPISIDEWIITIFLIVLGFYLISIGFASSIIDIGNSYQTQGSAFQACKILKEE